MDEYFDLLERYQEANPCLENGTPNIPFAILCDDWRYFCLENVPKFLDGYPNDGSCIVDPDTLQVIDYNTTPTAKRYYQKLKEEYKKGMISPETFLDTYEEYLDKLSTGAVLGMVDQRWQFFYAIQTAYVSGNLRSYGCDYVPLPITIDKKVKNQWHTARSAELDTASGLSITISCADFRNHTLSVWHNKTAIFDPPYQEQHLWTAYPDILHKYPEMFHRDRTRK